MASLDAIQAILEQIREDLPLLVQRSQIAPVQIVIGEGLSDISGRLGLIQAGEFRAGNSKEPGLGFTGVRMGYPAFTYNSQLWNIAGVSNDVLQFGFSATDGKAYFAAGVGVIDVNGLTFEASEYPAATPYVKWIDDADVVIGTLVSQWSGDDTNTWIRTYIREAAGTAYVSLLTGDLGTDDTDDPLTSLSLDSTGYIRIYLRGGTNTDRNHQAMSVESLSATDDDGSNLMYLDMYTSGTPDIGFGPFVVFRAQNAPKDEVLTQGSLGYVYEIATDDHEKSRLENFRLYDGAVIRQPIHEPDYRWQEPMISDFIGDGEDFNVAAFAAGGTIAVIPGAVDHPGIVRISSAAVNNTGGTIRNLGVDAGNYQDALLGITGGEVFYCVFRLQSTVTQMTCVLGYNDSLGAVATVDGVWINITSNTLTGKTSNNSTVSTTASSYTVSTNTWYRCVILVNSDASIVYFFLYNSATDALLWSDTLSTNIPTARATAMYTKAYRTNNVATDLIDVDWIAYYKTKELAR